jgi:membrane glycosyltransferase
VTAQRAGPVLAFAAPMRMRQSLADFEEAFVDEIDEDRHRRERLRAQAEQRTRRRRSERTRRQGTTRFWTLVLTLMATAVIVTIVMFRVLYIVMG